ncbi:MAG TPA: glycerol kinase [Microscillaceae bacterium]|nr:glycerol kinase [Microscillaceae bacterium]
MAQRYIIALDQGTTSSRALLLNAQGETCAVAQHEFTQYFPQSGWVEHDPKEIWDSQWRVLQQIIQSQALQPAQIAAIGITNQRETTVVWHRETGEPIYPAIVWQDKRTAALCDQLKTDGMTPYVRKTTGLVIDAYFSATKIRWILDNVPQARSWADAGKLAFGTVDSWLIWQLTAGKVHATDYTNASRTMLFDIQKLSWDSQLLDALQIPVSMMPQVKPSMAAYGEWTYEGVPIPISGVAGDQQAALFGQLCWQPGTAKNTYGTGCFMLMNIGDTIRYSNNGLITTLACSISPQPVYALEGSIFIGGAAIQWLRDGLKLIDKAQDSAYFAQQANPEHGVVVVPAFAGLGAPHWDMYARGGVFGLTRDSGKNELIRATLEAIAYQTQEVLAAMQQDAQQPIQTLKVDGGAAANNFLMQFQADVLQTTVERPQNVESTALGAAYLAGLGIGLWQPDDIGRFRAIDQVFVPQMTLEKREQLLTRWKKAVQRSMQWEA